MDPLLHLQEYLDTTSRWTVFKDIVFYYFLVSNVFIPFLYFIISPKRQRKVQKKLWDFIVLTLFHNSTQHELDKLRKTLAEKLIVNDPKIHIYHSLPKIGMSHKQVMEYMKEQCDVVDKGYAKVENGRVSGAVYHGGKELINLQSQVYELYCVSNQLHPDCFMSLRNIESEVVEMVLRLFTMSRAKKASTNRTTTNISTRNISTRNISTPNISTPNISTPNISTPNISTPNICTPNISTPNISTPNISTPNICTPNISTPNITTPNISTPNISTPNISTPNITTPNISTPIEKPNISTPIEKPNISTPTIDPGSSTLNVGKPNSDDLDTTTLKNVSPEIHISAGKQSDAEKPSVRASEIEKPTIETSNGENSDAPVPDFENPASVPANEHSINPHSANSNADSLNEKHMTDTVQSNTPLSKPKTSKSLLFQLKSVFRTQLHTGDYAYCGTTSSGGTESILLACLSARNFFLKRHLVTPTQLPQLIIPETAHAAFYKAAEYFHMELVVVPVRAEMGYRVDARDVARCVTSKTAMIVGSAPNFPHGIVDDIQGLSRIAIKWDIPLHVDCCLGSLLMPFYAETKGYEPFDFSVPGVTSISCDTHKYGYTPKGSSVIMYKYEVLRSAQYYIQTEWSGGLYGSPTLQGSRPGALVANCFSTLLNFGENGYRESFKRISSTVMEVAQFVRKDPLVSKYLEVIGDPKICVVAFKCKTGNGKFFNESDIYMIGDVLQNKFDYHLSSLQHPAALHYAITYLASSRENVASFMEALKQSVEIVVAEAKQNVINSAKDTTKKKKTDADTAQLYGVAGSIKTNGVAGKIVESFLDTMYKPVPNT